MTKESAVIPDENGVTPAVKLEGKRAAMVVCWLLGIGTLMSWNTMLTAEDYYYTLFAAYHPTRVLTLVYKTFALGVMAVLVYHEAKINTRRRNLIGYVAFFLSGLLVVVLDLATSGKGGFGTYIGVCFSSVIFGVADAHVRGGMTGDLSLMCPEFVQSFLGGMGAAGALTSILRFLTKAAFQNSKNGLRKGALLYLAISAFFEFLCILLYAYVFPKFPIVKYYRLKAASEGSKTVSADLFAGGIQTEPSKVDVQSAKLERLSNKELLKENIDYAVDLFLIYVLTLSIFPGFLSEDTGLHGLGSWYVIVLIASYNVADMVGRYIPLIEIMKLRSRKALQITTLSRFLLVPAFYFTAKYGGQGWMIMLSALLGLTNGYLTVCVFTAAPKDYKGPEKNALANMLVLCVLSGILVGIILDWMWLIGKGW